MRRALVHVAHHGARQHARARAAHRLNEARRDQRLDGERQRAGQRRQRDRCRARRAAPAAGRGDPTAARRTPARGKADEIGRDRELHLRRRRVEQAADRRQRRQIHVDRQRPEAGQHGEQQRQREGAGTQHAEAGWRHVQAIQARGAAPVARHAEAVQVGAVDVEPRLGAVGVRADAVHQPPEPRRVVHLDQMRHLVDGEIVQHERRREDEPPGIRQHAGGRARAPAARLVAHRDALDGDAELLGGAAARRFEIAQRLAAEEIADAAVDVRRLAGDAEQRLAVRAGLRPHRAAHARPVHDAMLDAAQRQHRAVGERRRLRQAAQPRRDPAAVLLRELLGLADAAARRHGEDDLAGRGVDAQRIAAGLAVAADAHRIDRLVEDDLDRLRFARTAIEQGAQRHH